jgi:hypothetical protein
MSPNKDLKPAFYLAAILFIVGTVCYAAFPAKKHEQPVRIMFKTLAGKVLFDHKTHASEKGYALSCGDCHHHPEGDASSGACGDCHINSEDNAQAPKKCLECHDSGDFDDIALTKRTDAFHNQCESCHEKADAGPKEKEKRCNWCHNM